MMALFGVMALFEVMAFTSVAMDAAISFISLDSPLKRQRGSVLVDYH